MRRRRPKPLIAFAAHASPLAGPIDAYQEYLSREYAVDLRRVNHPLDSYSGNVTRVLDGRGLYRPIKRYQIGQLNLVIDFVMTAIVMLVWRPDVIVAANNFDTCATLVSKLRRRPPQVVYFAADFSKHRFKSGALDAVYRVCEIVALRFADVVVSNTKRSERERIMLGLNPSKSVVVPNGADVGGRTVVQRGIRGDAFIFIGSVTREHGLYEMIEVLAPMMSEITIVGDGDDWDRVVQLLASLPVKKFLYRRIVRDEVLDLLISFSGFGLAPYNDDSDWTFYCSPLKVSEYLACGVPVIVSTVPEVASVIESNRLGIVYHHLRTSELKDRMSSFDTVGFSERAARFADANRPAALYRSIPIRLIGD